MRTIAVCATMGLMCAGTALLGADNYYLGVLGGVATLSPDARSSISSNGAQVSLYNPANGPALNLFAGWLASDYLSLQINYVRNSNDLTLVSTSAAGQGLTAYQQARSSSQNSLIGDVLVYFRKRRSRLRPYLSVGTGLVHLSSTLWTTDSVVGIPATPPQKFAASNAGLRVAVGIDVRIRNGWAFRYSFSETLAHNAVSDELSPSGQHGLMNFQNLFGFLKRF